MRARHLRNVWLAGLMGASLSWGLLPDLHAQAPRTPWGDPDLQGTYTNANTPAPAR